MHLPQGARAVGGREEAYARGDETMLTGAQPASWSVRPAPSTNPTTVSGPNLSPPLSSTEHDVWRVTVAEPTEKTVLASNEVEIVKEAPTSTACENPYCADETVVAPDGTVPVTSDREP